MIYIPQRYAVIAAGRIIGLPCFYFWRLKATPLETLTDLERACRFP